MRRRSSGFSGKGAIGEVNFNGRTCHLRVVRKKGCQTRATCRKIKFQITFIFTLIQLFLRDENESDSNIRKFNLKKLTTNSLYKVNKPKRCVI